jgi:peptidoglycan L-alanyl-D-glutamate endopeptidase CwlK
MRKLQSRGFGFLSEILAHVGPCYGKHVTNAGPGESWHNYGQAWDAVPLIGGKPVWNYLEGKDYWDAYGEAVRQSGMHWAGDWTTFREYPHAQLKPGSNPLKMLTPDEVKVSLLEHKLVSRDIFL